MHVFIAQYQYNPSLCNQGCPYLGICARSISRQNVESSQSEASYIDCYMINIFLEDREDANMSAIYDGYFYWIQVKKYAV